MGSTAGWRPRRRVAAVVSDGDDDLRMPGGYITGRREAGLGHRRSRRQTVTRRGIGIVAVGLSVAVTVGFGSTAMSSLHRSAIAAATITGTYRPASARNGLDTENVRVTYRFEAAGASYDGIATRPWSSGQIATAKVCYDPKDPAGSHALELAAVECGSFDPFAPADY